VLGGCDDDPEPLPGRSSVGADLGKDSALEPSDAIEAHPAARSARHCRHAGESLVVRTIPLLRLVCFSRRDGVFAVLSNRGDAHDSANEVARLDAVS
jgi:hypothetical protein